MTTSLEGIEDIPNTTAEEELEEVRVCVMRCDYLRETRFRNSKRLSPNKRPTPMR